MRGTNERIEDNRTIVFKIDSDFSVHLLLSTFDVMVGRSTSQFLMKRLIGVRRGNHHKAPKIFLFV